jgi:hypothetical protein
MTARFDAFEAALEALCVEHGVRLSTGYDDYCDPCISVEASADAAGCDLYLFEEVTPTPEEIAEREAREAEQRARVREEARLWRLSEPARLAEIQGSAEYRSYAAVIEADIAEQRKKQMRVSTDPNDPAYVDARPRKAWVNDVLIEGWTVADEFRRCVITPERVYNGSVRVERLPAVVDAPTEWPTIDITQVAEDTVVLPITSLPKVKQETFKGKRR